MSAVLSGTCSKCKGKYYVSMGHPKWFSDHTEGGKPNAIFESFQRLRQSKVCPQCGRAEYARFASSWKKHSAPEGAPPNGKDRSRPR